MSSAADSPESGSESECELESESESDGALLDGWAAGDADAGRRLYRRYCDRITDFFARKTDRDVADLVQRTFARCLQARRDADRRIEHPRAYLFKTATNLLYDHFRAGARSQDVEPAATSLADLRTGPATLALRRQAHRRLLLALARIPLDDQIALELSYWEGLPMAELAEVLGVGRSAAISRVHRARARLRAALEALGATEADATATVTDFEGWRKKLRSIAGSSVYSRAPGDEPG